MPVETKSFPMPCDDGFRFDDAKGGFPFRPNTGEPDPEKMIGGRHAQPVFLVPTLENEELMA